MEYKVNNAEKELINSWKCEIFKVKRPYQEPFLNLELSLFMNEICKILKQDDVSVFVSAINIVEKYIKIQNEAHQSITNPVLVVFVGIILSAKFHKEQRIKPIQIQRLIFLKTKYKCSVKSILKMEREMLATLQTLMLPNIVEDVKMIMVMFQETCKIKVSLIPLGLKVVELMYMRRNEWFFMLKALYVDDEGDMCNANTFKELMSRGIFVSLGIFGFVLSLTKYSFCLDIETIMDDFCEDAGIDKGHVNLLIDVIKKMYDNIGEED